MFCDPAEVIEELRLTLDEIDPPDWLTFSGAGEPTLHAGLGRLLAEVKAMGVAPSCVITNSTLLGREDVRSELLLSDRILPTLTTVNEATFTRIHRPPVDLILNEVLDGLRKFCGMYKGIVDLEIFVCPGLNDTPIEIAGLQGYIANLSNLASIYLNTAVRPPVDGEIRPASVDELESFKEHLRVFVPISTAFDHSPLPRKGVRKPPPAHEAIQALLLRHPCSIGQMERVLNLSGDLILETLKNLKAQNLVEVGHDGLWRRQLNNSEHA